MVLVDCFHCFLRVSEHHKPGVLITQLTIIKLLVMSKTVRGMTQHAQLPMVLQGSVSFMESVSNLTLKISINRNESLYDSLLFLYSKAKNLCPVTY